MTTQQPEALRLAEEITELMCSTEAAARTIAAAADELCRLHAENETLHAERDRNLNSIRVCNEIINKKNAELESLRMGYAAARLEIESLQARIKTMAEEHADELMVAHLDGRMRAALAAAPAQPAPQQEAVAWYVTGCSRLLDEDEAKAEARHIGGTARAIPLYTAPQPAPQQEAQEPAFWTVCAQYEGGGETGWIPLPGYSNETEHGVKNLVLQAARKEGYKGTATGRLMELRWEIRPVYLAPWAAPKPSPTPQADSVTAPAAGAVAHTLSDAQIEAMPVWRNFVGLWPESRREIVDAVVDLLTTPPTQAADSVLEDAARLDWLLLHISGAEFRRIGVHYSGNARRADVDAARKQGANHD